MSEVCDRVSLQGGVCGQHRGGDQPDLGLVGGAVGDGNFGGVRGFLRPDLFRLCGVFLDGDRGGELVGIHDSGEFPVSVSGNLGGGFLAALAHFAEQLAAGFRLHPAGGQSAGRGEAVCEFDGDDVAGRFVARGELEFCDLGWTAWRGSGGESFVDGLAGAGGFFGEESGMGQVGEGGCGVGCGAGVCNFVLGAVPGGVFCGYAGGAGWIVECGLRGGWRGEEFPLDVGAGAAGGGYFFGFAEGGERRLGCSQAGVGGGFIGAGGAGGDFVHEGGVGAVFVFSVLSRLGKINHREH